MADDRDIFQLLADETARAGLEFLLIGGHAVNAHGYTRTTVDLDFLIASTDLARWKEILAAANYEAIHEVEAFAQFQAVGGEDYRVDLMLVDGPTFSKLLAGSEWVNYGQRRIRVAGALHLIALKLHACRTYSRSVQGKDFYDILQLIRLKRIDPAAEDFQEILNRYATPAIRERLLRDLGADL